MVPSKSSTHHHGRIASVCRQLAHGNQEAAQETHPAKGNRDCKGRPDTNHVSLHNSRQNFGRENIAQLRGSREQQSGRINTGSRGGECSEESVDKGGLTCSRAECTSERLQDCTEVSLAPSQ